MDVRCWRPTGRPIGSHTTGNDVYVVGTAYPYHPPTLTSTLVGMPIRCSLSVNGCYRRRGLIIAHEDIHTDCSDVDIRLWDIIQNISSDSVQPMNNLLGVPISWDFPT
jgi:hypothetical protein